MSNRTEDQISARAELRLSHLAQIEALTKPGLAPLDRIQRFADAAEFSDKDRMEAQWSLRMHSYAVAVWLQAEPQKSLFANLPGCKCPVMEKLDGVPSDMFCDWKPTVDVLEPFSRIQIERRFPTHD
ncbi:MAG TPA: hypothetical protein VMT72_12210 [Pseudolabrys sp.]|nr:hypothetical protein [Pseudolabrys sp.]